MSHEDSVIKDIIVGNDFSLQKTDGSDWTDLVLEIAHLDSIVTGQKGAFNFFGESCDRN